MNRKLLFVLVIFLVSILHANAFNEDIDVDFYAPMGSYNENYTNITLDWDGWCLGYDIVFKVYNVTQWEDRDDIEDDEDLFFLNVSDGEYTVYDGPFDSAPVLKTGDLSTTGTFSAIFEYEDNYLIEVEMDSDSGYNDYELLLEIYKCKTSDEIVSIGTIGGNSTDENATVVVVETNSTEVNASETNVTALVGNVTSNVTLDDISNVSDSVLNDTNSASDLGNVTFSYVDVGVVLDINETDAVDSSDVSVIKHDDFEGLGVSSLIAAPGYFQIDIGEKQLGTMKIKLNITNFMNDVDKAYRFDDDIGDWVEVPYEYVDNQVVIETTMGGTENSTIVDNADDSSLESFMPDWLITALVGGVIILAGGVAVVIYMMKKKKDSSGSGNHVEGPSADVQRQKVKDYIMNYKDKYSKENIEKVLMSSGISKELIGSVFADINKDGGDAGNSVSSDKKESLGGDNKESHESDKKSEDVTETDKKKDEGNEKGSEEKSEYNKPEEKKPLPKEPVPPTVGPIKKEDEEMYQ